jgi:hypothetical protein
LHTKLAPVALALAAALPAQADISITAGTNLFFDVVFNTQPVVYQATADYFSADPFGDPAGVMFKTAWAYRLDGDTQESILNKGAPNQPIFSNNGNVGTAIWPDVDGRGLISMAIVYTAHSTGPQTGQVTARATVINISQNPVTLNLFHLSDVDLCGGGYGTNIATPGDDGRQTYTGSTCQETAQQFAAGADRWEVGSYNNVPANSGNIDLYNQLEDASITNLRNDAVPFGPFDVRSAFQWQDKVLEPGTSRTFTIAFAHNENACAYGDSTYGVGMAGGRGVPQLTMGAPAILGQTMRLDVTNGPSNLLGACLIGFTPVDLAFADLHILVGAPSATGGMLTDANGNASLSLTTPNDPTLCGGRLVSQVAFFGDTSSRSVTGFPLTLTPGLNFHVGIY